MPDAASAGASAWDQRYRDGRDGWELGRPAAPFQRFLSVHPLAPRPPARVLVPGCGRGHEARLLADLGFEVIGLDFSAEALAEARRLQGSGDQRLRWLQLDLLQPEALARAGLTPGSVDGVLEHTCLCALEPKQRRAWCAALGRLLAPGGWLLGLFACHRQPGGPPWGASPSELEALLRSGGFRPVEWLPALNPAVGRDGRPRQDEWLGFWRRAPAQGNPAEADPPAAAGAVGPMAGRTALDAVDGADGEPGLPSRCQRPPLVLSIGGSDSGGGAGIQADLRTFAALQVHGCSAITCVTAQNTLGVERVEPIAAAAVIAQVEAIARDLPPRALKTGMLLDRPRIEATASAIAPLAAFRLIDPVMVSRAGAVLLEAEAIQALQDRLLPLADLVTPNRHEAALLWGQSIESPADLERAARDLARRTPAALLLKGGGLAGCRGRDLFWQGDEGHWLQTPAVDTPHTHGSGCTLSAAIVAWIARGLPLPQAIAAAKAFVQAGLVGSLAIGGGQGPLGHWCGQLERGDGSAGT